MEEEKSKSQKKKEACELQKIGVAFTKLNEEKLNKLQLPEYLYKAITCAKSLKSHGAIRRQEQLIGKLMRDSDLNDVLINYKNLLNEDNSKTAEFHSIELWREKLINEGKIALTEFINTYSHKDTQQLRQLINKAINDKNKAQNTGASLALFRYLKKVIEK